MVTLCHINNNARISLVMSNVTSYHINNNVYISDVTLYQSYQMSYCINNDAHTSLLIIIRTSIIMSDGHTVSHQ